MKGTRRPTLAAVALLLAACTPSLNLQVDLPGPAELGFTVLLEASTSTGPAPLTVVFTAGAQESASYGWYVNDRRLSRRQDILTYTFREAGSYEVTVAATNAAGDTDTESVTVDVTGDEDESDSEML